MKRFLLIFVLFLNFSFLYCQTTKVMTFNIRYDNPNDEKNSWNNRKNEFIEMLKYYEPDIIGFQEVLSNQLDFINNNLKGYLYVGVGREDGKRKGEFSPIFFKKSKYNLIKENTFWLSDTPEKVSVGWDAALERICTYAILKKKRSNETIFVFNTHFDHIGKTARIKSAELILKKISEIVPDTSIIILMGDFNCLPDEEPIKKIKEKLFYAAELCLGGVYGPKGTFNSFDEKLIVSDVIDYIFVRNLKVQKYRHIDDRMKNNNFISDHYPVIMECKKSKK